MYDIYIMTSSQLYNMQTFLYKQPYRKIMFITYKLTSYVSENTYQLLCLIYLSQTSQFFHFSLKLFPFFIKRQISRVSTSQILAFWFYNCNVDYHCMKRMLQCCLKIFISWAFMEKNNLLKKCSDSLG